MNISPRTRNLLKWAFSFFSMLAIIGLTVSGFFWYLAKNEEATCLARDIDDLLDKRAATKHRTQPATVERQIEAIAHWRIASVRRNQMGLCPGSWLEWVIKSANAMVFGTGERSPRWQIIYPSARRAVVGDYQYTWPSEWDCVDDIKTTNGRPSNWWKSGKYAVVRFFDPNANKVAGKIDNMTLYCTGTVKTGK